jgi:hypothetical protein
VVGTGDCLRGESEFKLVETKLHKHTHSSHMLNVMTGRRNLQGAVNTFLRMVQIK